MADKKVIALVGLIGSGKDTVADYLQNIHHFRRESFASTLKDAVSCIFGWDRDFLEGRTSYSREWRETIDEWWSARLDIPDLTPRWVLQHWGTNVLRSNFHNDIWIASLENKLRNNRDNVIITDCRFPNEIDAITEQGGVVIRIKRGDDPVWFSTAKLHCNSKDPLIKQDTKEYLDKHDIHPSEYSWAGHNFDCILTNDTTLSELYSQVNDLLQDLHLSIPNLTSV